MLNFQGTVAESLDSSEDDLFDGKSYLGKGNKTYEIPFAINQTKKTFLLSSKQTKPQQKKEIPNHNAKNIQQNCYTPSNLRSCISQENILSAMTSRNDPIYRGSYNRDVLPYVSSNLTINRNFKTEPRYNKDWLPTKENFLTEGAIMGKY